MLVTNESWYVVRNTPNVTGFLWAWNIPVPVSGEELERLKWKIKENTKIYSTDFSVWNEAIIKWGTFEWNEGVISEVNEKKATVTVVINLLWRDTPVELGFSEVQLKNKN
jgi:transcriptional antiterminator NusG